MKEDLFLTIEQMKHLEKLGLKTSDAAFVWNTNMYTKDTRLDTGYIDKRRSVYTYTLEEVLHRLPDEISVNGEEYNLISKSDEGIGYGQLCVHRGWGDEPYASVDFYVVFDSGNEKENAYNLLCWVLANVNFN